MIKYFLLLLLPILLSANLTYVSNYNKEVSLLESFDIKPSFLYDSVLNKMKAEKVSKHKNKRFFEAMDNAYLFIPAIKNILSEYGIPPEFLYLVMAESNFSNRAYSRKRASGLWQFMPQTAKHYGLKINAYVDERRDLVKATRAAAKYLSSLHSRFGRWYLAAIAYNCGGGRLSKAIEKAGTKDLDVLLNPRKKYIPRESRLYIRKIVALALIGYDEQFLLKREYDHLLNRASAYSVATVKLAGGASLKRLSRLIGLPLSELKKLNRHLKYDFVPPYTKGYDVYIPYIKLSEFKQKYYEEKNQNIYKVHVVKRGDNLSKIGRKYGVKYRVIMDFNKLRNSRLRLRQKLIIPIENKRARNIKFSSNYDYMVKRGDTLNSISKAFKVSVKNIIHKNHIKNSLIKTGDRLKIYE